MRSIAPSPMVGEQVRPEKVKSQTPIFFDGRHLCRSWGTDANGDGGGGKKPLFRAKKNQELSRLLVSLQRKKSISLPVNPFHRKRSPSPY